jgi:hypothetical protein
MSAAGAEPGRGRIRFLAGGFTIGVHLMVLGSLFWPSAAHSPPRHEPAPIMLSLTESPKPPDLPKTAENQPEGAPEVDLIQPTRPRATMPDVLMAESEPDDSSLLSESDLAGATRAGEGGTGMGGCDTAQLVQQALRRDRLVHSAVADAHLGGKAILLWNGDWVRSGGQEGKGLAAVREAVMWEVAFAPPACREAKMHGLVLLSLTDGGTRFAIGSGDWRWSDLLGLRDGAPAVRKAG